MAINTRNDEENNPNFIEKDTSIVKSTQIDLKYIENYGFEFFDQYNIIYKLQLIGKFQGTRIYNENLINYEIVA